MIRTMGHRTCLLAAVLVLSFAVGCDQKKPPTTSTRFDLTPLLAPNTLVDGAISPGQWACLDLLGAGWYPPEKKKGGRPHVWSRGPRSTLTLPVIKAGPGHIIVRGLGLNDLKGPRTLQLVVNGNALDTVALPRRKRDMMFEVPRGVLFAGWNLVELITDRTVVPVEAGISGDSRDLGVMVELLRFLPSGQAGETPPEDPYENLEGGALNADRKVFLRLGHLAGADLEIGWKVLEASSGAAVQVRVQTDFDEDPLFCETFPVSEKNLEDDLEHAHLSFPPDLPAQVMLVLSLEAADGQVGNGEVLLQSASLAWQMTPLNVVLIVVDTLRPDFLGCYNDSVTTSPAIDRLAADGILFTEAFTNSPITGPSHATIFSSRYPSQHGVLNNFFSIIPPRRPLLAEILQIRGYATGAAVSMPPVGGTLGFARGFDKFNDDFGNQIVLPADLMVSRVLEILGSLDPPLFCWAHFCDPHEPYDAHGLVEHTADIEVNGKLLARVSTSSHLVQTFSLDLRSGDSPLRFSSDRPFMIRALKVKAEDGTRVRLDPLDLAGKTAPRFDLTIRKPEPGRAELIVGFSDCFASIAELRERYAREVGFVDRQVGALLDTLRERDLYEESLIVFTSDHGEALGERGGLVGHVSTLYDPMLRIPLIIKPPRLAGIKGGKRRDDPVSLADILPTILAQLQIPLLPGARGTDILARGKPGRDRKLFLETHAPQAPRTLYGLRDHRFKIIHATDPSEFEVYDLRRDGKEAENLFDKKGKKSREWRDLLLDGTAALQAGRETAVEAEVDEDTRQKLKALGY